jgi:UDP-N-acetylmuramoylalanine--D-glutamate ligase
VIDVAQFVAQLQNKPVGIYGLGLSNLAVLGVLTKAGGSVITGDDKPENHPGALSQDEFLAQDFSRFACLVLAPGISFIHHPHPVVLKARQAGLEILCDIEILSRCNPGRKAVSITGTNGKSTTTALLGHILRECGVPASVGGNIGTPVLDLELPTEQGVFVLELSSFQLDLCPSFAPEIAIHLNLTADHLDRHGTMESYANAKLKMFRGPGQAILSIDDEWSERMGDLIRDKGERDVYSLSVGEPVAKGISIEDGMLIDAMDGKPTAVFAMDFPALPGAHNHQNAGAAYAAARLLGLEPEAIRAAMQSFPGLTHRQFRVRTIGQVAYINDSKGTNADAAARALDCYDDIYWIAGGRAKEGGLEGLDSYLGSVRHAFLIGEAADGFMHWLNERGVACTSSGTLERAVEEAHALAQKAGQGTVLLSPACASYDQFRNFEERGAVFMRLVENLEPKYSPPPFLGGGS